jgi:hypothetical protein
MPETIHQPVQAPALLQGIARTFRDQQFVGDEVAPVRDADFETGKYTEYGRDDLYEVDTTYSHGSVPNAITSREAENTFVTELRVIRHPLLDKDTNPRRPGGGRRRLRVTAKVTKATWIAREGRVARAYTATANFAAGHVLTKGAGTEWNHATQLNTLTPITDLESRIDKVTSQALVPRNMVDVVVPQQVFDAAIRYNTAIREFYKYTQAGVTSAELMAGFLGVRRFFIASGFFAGTGPENAAADISTGIPATSLWGDNVWVGVVDSEDMDMLTFGRQFSYTGDTNGQEVQIRQYRMADEGQRGDWIEAAEQRDLKITANFAGALITNTMI